jgi:ubiquinone/menaquinone biosynthesis C-methylase UbiE
MTDYYMHAGVPVTGPGRSPDYLARVHGYRSVDELSESLPNGSLILDVGSGLSRFGGAIACANGGIEVVNVDTSYANPQVLDEATAADIPLNLRFLEADATQLTTVFGAESVDQIFSYWMLPHLISRGTAQDAIIAMHSVLKVGGSLSIGPKAYGSCARRTVRITKTAEDIPTQLAGMIESQCSIPFAASSRTIGNL